ncbi:MAG: hypothetical protein E7619_04940 [Ruminococcaceae bacterium]|nr:hypothetical protein [Oscillospiraceae bacterium]
MKKLTLIIITLMLAAAFAACGTKAPTGDTDPVPGGTEQAQTSSPAEEITGAVTEKAELKGKAYIPAKNIGIRFDTTKRRREMKSDSMVFYGEIGSIVALTYDDEFEEYTDSVDKVFDLLNDGEVFEDISIDIGGNFRGDDKYIINLISSEKTTVAGLESVKILGNVKDHYGKTALVYGYTFVIDKTPCMLVGVVIDEANNRDVVQAIKEEVDLMAQTIKEE